MEPADVKARLERFHSSAEDTLGLLWIMGKFECFILEDQFQAVKVMKETRIPAGIYEIKLRTEGSHHEKYSKMFPEFHKGMLHLQDVKGFQFILIHIGNDEEDTDGCLIPGNVPRFNPLGRSRLEESTAAYKRIYQIITKMLETERVFIEVVDRDRRAA